ncbi:MAG: hypothetical protein PVF68_07935 [Acidobacteriota bacterium]|jgi:hypothetical protein
MNPPTSNVHSQQVKRFPGRIRTVALCHVDPERLTMAPTALPTGHGTHVLITMDCEEAIQAALAGEVDVLVVNGARITPEGLTALSFLKEEKPALAVYFFLEEGAGQGRLQPWARAA